MQAFHAADQGGDGVGVAGHGAGEGSLGKASRVRFGQVSEHGELIWGAASMRDAAAEGLIQAVPCPAEQHGEATAIFRTRD